MTNKLLYIAGMGHNGSTFMDLLLGESARTVSTSQLIDLWSRYEPDPGTRETDSAWTEVLGCLSDEEKEALKKANLGVLRERRLLPFLLSRSKRREYARANRPLLEAVFRRWPDHLVIDSSKNISRAIGLQETPGTEVYCLHLVRDVRGYLNSHNSRRSARGASRTYVGGTAVWAAKNWAASSFLKDYASHYRFLRYEDFVRHPLETLADLERWLDHSLEGSRQCLHDGRAISISDKPVFFGNRILQGKEVQFRPESRRDSPLHRSRLYWYSLGWVAWPYRYRRLDSRGDND